MIYRSWGEGCLMITQPAHAWLAGELTDLWGNEVFQPPRPQSAVVLATRLHDIGWVVWEKAPRLGEDGQPVNFLGLTFSETVPIWKAAVAHVSSIDPYAALLVNMHAVTVYRQRLQRGTDAIAERSAVEAELERLMREQEVLRAGLAHHDDYRQVSGTGFSDRAYRWLRVCDLLSLTLCSDVMPHEGEIENVPWNTQERFTTLRYQNPRPFELILDPFPFPEKSLRLTIQARALDKVAYPNQTAFQAALKKAQWITQPVSISAG